MYDFDKIIDRRGTHCNKYDNEKVYKDAQMIPLWVADMDFETLPEISQALKKVVDQKIYGYTSMGNEYYDSLIKWMNERHDFNIEKEWIVPTIGVITGLRLAILTLTQKNDHVMIMKPVYYPFDRSININDRQIVECPLNLKEGHYECDFDLFEKKIIENDVKLFILCNPHNPVGRVWTKEELYQMGMICKKHHVYVVIDEIHMDFIHPGYKHIPFFNVDESFKDFSIVCTSPSKTFNMAGIQVANIIIENKEIRERFLKLRSMAGISTPNIFALSACQAAYTYGAQWVDELNTYIHANYEYMKNYIKEKMPQLKVIEPEGLYLVWVDMHALNMDKIQLEEFMLKKAHLWLDEGYVFGTGGEGFERFNIACPRSVLKRALDQLYEAINSL